MIHKALLGTIDRFLGVYIEHTMGAFPLWLSPVQAKVLAVSEKHVEYAKEVANALKAAHIRVEIDDANESLGKKIRNAKTEKIPYLLVVGDKEIEDKTVSADSRDHGKLDAMLVTDFLNRATEEIKTRK
ncbi:MAG: His/Gly/Thr/Pro-type tRNA ligase C-terminal domain-containing protein [archaeon]